MRKFDLLFGLAIVAISLRADEISAPKSMHELSGGTRAVSSGEQKLVLIDLKNRKGEFVKKDKEGNWLLLPNRVYQRYEPSHCCPVRSEIERELRAARVAGYAG